MTRWRTVKARWREARRRAEAQQFGRHEHTAPWWMRGASLIGIWETGVLDQQTRRQESRK